MHHRRSQGILVFAQRGEQRGHTGADLRSKDDRDASGQCDEALGGHHYHQADGRRRGLDERREKRSHEHPEDRSFHGLHQLNEALVRSEGRHGVTHGRHAVKY